MHPTLLSIGPFDFHAYTVTLAIAFLVGVLGAVRENYKLPNPYPVTPAGGVWIFFGALVGAKVYWYLQYGLTFAYDDGTPYAWYRVFFMEGGMVYFGDLSAAFSAAWRMCAGCACRLSPWPILACPSCPWGIPSRVWVAS